MVDQIFIFKHIMKSLRKKSEDTHVMFVYLKMAYSSLVRDFIVDHASDLYILKIGEIGNM